MFGMKNSTAPPPPVNAPPLRPSSAGLVPALARAAALLDAVAATPAPPTLAGLARALAIPKSTAHGLCRTLCALGLLRPRGGGFALGPHVLAWARSFLAGSDIVAEFNALLAADRRLSRHTVTLSTLEGAEVAYLACRNGPAPLDVSFRPGMRLPAVFTATGKAMLARLDGAALAAALGRGWPARLTPRGVRSRAALAVELAAARRRGYAVDDGQVRIGMVCVGAAVADAAGAPAAGLAISLTREEATPAAVAATGAAVAAMARALAGRLG